MIQDDNVVKSDNLMRDGQWPAAAGAPEQPSAQFRWQYHLIPEHPSQATGFSAGRNRIEFGSETLEDRLDISLNSGKRFMQAPGVDDDGFHAEINGSACLNIMIFQGIVTMSNYRVE